MAGAAPLYSPQVRAPDGLSFTVQPAPLPGVPSVAPAAVDTSLGTALTAAGKEVLAVNTKISDAQDETAAALARTEYLKRIDDLRAKYTQSDDYKNAETNFATDAANAQRELLGGISDPKRRAQTGLQMEVQAINGQRVVRTTMLSKEADTNVAGLNARLATYATSAASAPTPAARQAIVQSADADIQQQVSAGWLHATDGARASIQLRQTLDQTDARRAIDKDPAAAAVALQDPKQFPNLSPGIRQTLLDTARNATDQVQTAHWATVAHFNPAQAIATVGIASTPQQADKIFRGGIMPTENPAGDNNAVSPKGAVGLSQIMPQTAVEVAHQLGLHVFDGIEKDDAAITAKLKADRNLNVRLGNTYWQSLVARYGGNVAVAAAAYNGGSGRADAWMQQAVAKFGPNFTAAQFQSVVDIRETHDYIAKVYKNLGADANGGGLTTLGQVHAAAAVTAAVNSADAIQLRQLSAAATMSREGNDFADQFKNGQKVDPVSYASAMQTNIHAARAGDQQAAEWVRKTQLAEHLAPMRDQAYRMSPAHLAQTVSQMQEFLQTHPVQPGDDVRLNALKEVLKDVTTRAKSDPIGLAERAKIIQTPVVVDPQADASDPTLGASLGVRAAQAQAVQTFYGGQLKILKPQEAQAFQARYAEASPDEKFALLHTASSSLPPPALKAFLNQVGGGNSTTVLAGMVAKDRPEIARQILQGSELLKSKETQANLKEIRPAFSSKLGGQIYPDPEMQKAVEGASLSLYVARAAQDGTLYDAADNAAVEKAIEDVTGPIIKRNGVKVPIAPSIDPGRFVGALDHLSEHDVQLMGGAYDGSGQPVTAADISGYAVLKPLAIGSPLYVVGMRDPRARDGFRPLFTASVFDGPAPRPLVFNMSVLARQSAPSPVAMTPYQQGISRYRAQLWRTFQEDRLKDQQRAAQP